MVTFVGDDGRGKSQAMKPVNMKTLFALQTLTGGQQTFNPPELVLARIKQEQAASGAVRRCAAVFDR